MPEKSGQVTYSQQFVTFGVVSELFSIVYSPAESPHFPTFQVPDQDLSILLNGVTIGGHITYSHNVALS